MLFLEPRVYYLRLVNFLQAVNKKRRNKTFWLLGEVILIKAAVLIFGCHTFASSIWTMILGEFHPKLYMWYTTKLWCFRYYAIASEVWTSTVGTCTFVTSTGHYIYRRTDSRRTLRAAQLLDTRRTRRCSQSSHDTLGGQPEGDRSEILTLKPNLPYPNLT